MLAAAIRASLIEAGEPDTSMQSASATSPHQQPHATDRLMDQQQDSLPVPVPSSSVTQQAAGSLQDQQQLQGERQQQYGGQQQHHQHSQQQQQQQQQYGQQLRPGHDPPQQGLPDRFGVTSGFDAAAYQFGGIAAALQGTAPSKGQSQGSSQQGLEQARGMQMRPSWTSNALMQGGYEEAEPLVSAASTPVDGICSLIRSFLCLFIHSFIHWCIQMSTQHTHVLPLGSSTYRLSWLLYGVLNTDTSKALHHEHSLYASGRTLALCEDAECLFLRLFCFSCD